MTAYGPGCNVTTVPASEAANDAGLGLEPLTVSVKSPAFFVPPLSLTTCLITVSFGAAFRVLVIVQVAVSPKWASVPEHPSPSVVV